jgi:hypothetical protein
MLTLIAAAVTLAQLNTTSPPGLGAAYSAYEHCMLEAAKDVDDYISDAKAHIRQLTCAANYPKSGPDRPTL